MAPTFTSPFASAFDTPLLEPPLLEPVALERVAPLASGLERTLTVRDDDEIFMCEVYPGCTIRVSRTQGARITRHVLKQVVRLDTFRSMQSPATGQPVALPPPQARPPKLGAPQVVVVHRARAGTLFICAASRRVKRVRFTDEHSDEAAVRMLPAGWYAMSPRSCARARQQRAMGAAASPPP